MTRPTRITPVQRWGKTSAPGLATGTGLFLGGKVTGPDVNTSPIFSFRLTTTPLLTCCQQTWLDGTEGDAPRYKLRLYVTSRDGQC